MVLSKHAMGDASSRYYDDEDHQRDLLCYYDDLQDL